MSLREKWKGASPRLGRGQSRSITSKSPQRLLRSKSQPMVFPEDSVFQKNNYYSLLEILDKMVTEPHAKTSTAKKALLSYYPQFTTDDKVMNALKELFFSVLITVDVNQWDKYKHNQDDQQLQLQEINEINQSDLDSENDTTNRNSNQNTNITPNTNALTNQNLNTLNLATNSNPSMLSSPSPMSISPGSSGVISIESDSTQITIISNSTTSPPPFPFNITNNSNNTNTTNTTNNNDDNDDNNEPDTHLKKSSRSQLSISFTNTSLLSPGETADILSSVEEVSDDDEIEDNNFELKTPSPRQRPSDSEDVILPLKQPKLGGTGTKSSDLVTPTPTSANIKDLMINNPMIAPETEPETETENDENDSKNETENKNKNKNKHKNKNDNNINKILNEIDESSDSEAYSPKPFRISELKRENHRYNIVSSNINDPNYDEYAEKDMDIMQCVNKQLRVVNLMQTWMKTCWNDDFDRNSKMKNMMQSFSEQIRHIHIVMYDPHNNPITQMMRYRSLSDNDENRNNDQIGDLGLIEIETENEDTDDSKNSNNKSNLIKLITKTSSMDTTTIPLKSSNNQKKRASYIWDPAALTPSNQSSDKHEKFFPMITNLVVDDDIGYISTSNEIEEEPANENENENRNELVIENPKTTIKIRPITPFNHENIETKIDVNRYEKEKRYENVSENGNENIDSGNVNNTNRISVTESGDYQLGRPMSPVHSNNTTSRSRKTTISDHPSSTYSLVSLKNSNSNNTTNSSINSSINNIIHTNVNNVNNINNTNNIANNDDNNKPRLKKRTSSSVEIPMSETQPVSDKASIASAEDDEDNNIQFQSEISDSSSQDEDEKLQTLQTPSDRNLTVPYGNDTNNNNNNHKNRNSGARKQLIFQLSHSNPNPSHHQSYTTQLTKEFTNINPRNNNNTYFNKRHSRKRRRGVHANDSTSGGSIFSGNSIFSISGNNENEPDGIKSLNQFDKRLIKMANMIDNTMAQESKKSKDLAKKIDVFLNSTNGDLLTKHESMIGGKGLHLTKQEQK